MEILMGFYIIGFYDFMVVSEDWHKIYPTKMGMGTASGNQTWLAGKSFIYLLVLSREWMGMGEWGNGMIIDSYCESFPTKHK